MRQLPAVFVSMVITLVFQSPSGAFQENGVQPVPAAAARRLIPWQGYLTHPDPGNPREYKPVPDGRYTILFTLYSAPVGGSSMVWGPERHQDVVVVNGLVNALLGSVITLDDKPAGFFGRPLYVGITIDTNNNPQEPNLELVPRQVLLPTMYAHEAGHAKDADTARKSELSSNSENLGGFPAASILAGIPPFPPAARQVRDAQRLDGHTWSELDQRFRKCEKRLLQLEEGLKQGFFGQAVHIARDKDKNGQWTQTAQTDGFVIVYTGWDHTALSVTVTASRDRKEAIGPNAGDPGQDTVRAKRVNGLYTSCLAPIKAGETWCVKAYQDAFDTNPVVNEKDVDVLWVSVAYRGMQSGDHPQP